MIKDEKLKTIADLIGCLLATCSIIDVAGSVGRAINKHPMVWAYFDEETIERLDKALGIKRVKKLKF